MTHFENSESPSPKAVILLILAVLEAHYTRQAEHIKDILAGFVKLDTAQLTQQYVELKNHCSDDTQAVQFISEWITASLDGGTLTLSDMN